MENDAEQLSAAVTNVAHIARELVDTAEDDGVHRVVVDEDVWKELKEALRTWTRASDTFIRSGKH